MPPISPMCMPRSSSRRCFAKGYKAALRLVPQREADAAEALQQGQAADRAQLRMIAQHARQAIVGNAAAEVVDVMDADIGREPAQEARQVVVRAAVQRRDVGVPVAGLRPTRILELVLD